MTEDETIELAFPKLPDGRPMCCHCRKHREGYLMLCADCWNALSAFAQITILNARPRVEKARLILITRPKVA
jgi:predicted amidophosphoribosyltransferase